MMERRLQWVEDRIDKFEESIDGLSNKLDSLNVGVAEIRVDTKWTKRLICFLFFAIIGTGITVAFKNVNPISVVQAQTQEVK